MHDEHLTEQEIIRRQKAEELRKKGIDPFGSAFKRTHHTNDIINEYDKFSREELEEKKIPVIIAGRIVLKRGQGKAGFMHIQDRDNKLQVYVRKDEVDEEDRKSTRLNFSHVRISYAVFCLKKKTKNYRGTLFVKN